MAGLFAPSQIDSYLNQVNQNNFPGGNINPNVQPQAAPPPQQQPSEVDALNYLAQQRQPKYTGDPNVDKYIHMFIGGNQ